ncbi:MAG: CYTH domain-containing protein [Caldilineaceae bacterium]
MADEIELKFALADDAAYARWTDLRTLDERYTVTPAAEPQIAIVDTYLDTADHRFLRHGYALRQRCARHPCPADAEGAGRRARNGPRRQLASSA